MKIVIKNVKTQKENILLLVLSLGHSPMSVIQTATLSYMRLRIMIMTKLMHEAVTEVASCGVMKGPTTCSCAVGLSFMMLAKAAYTARRYAITPMMQAMISEIFRTETTVIT